MQRGQARNFEETKPLEIFDIFILNNLVLEITFCKILTNGVAMKMRLTLDVIIVVLIVAWLYNNKLLWRKDTILNAHI